MTGQAALLPARRIAPPDWMTDPATARVVQALAADGAAVRFVGGCVRDALMGIAAKDVDIAVAMRPEVTLRLLRMAGLRAEPTGIAHGTVSAFVDRRTFEVTSLRVDAETFGRHARVAFTDDWRADAARRDFTMNALYADSDGAIYDPIGGLPDLDARKVRFIGEARQRIAEDALRILRFFRFFARFDPGPPDPAALAACAADRHLLRGLSGERLREECLGILRTARAAAAFRLMAECGVAEPLIGPAPALDRLDALVAAEARHGCAPAPQLRLAALLPDRPAAASLADRLRLSNRDAAQLALLVGLPRAQAAELAQAAEAPGGSAARRLLQRHGAAAMAGLALLAEAGGLTEDGGGLIRASRDWQPIGFPLRGADLLARGVPAGPAVGRLLAAVRLWWEEGDYRADRAACLGELDRLLAAGEGA
ncbi:MAG: hypothetical protein RLO22_05795 [Sneathiellaceae bacterium]